MSQPNPDEELFREYEEYMNEAFGARLNNTDWNDFMSFEDYLDMRSVSDVRVGEE